MSEQSCLLALQPYLALAKSATGRAAADLVTQATQAPGVFVFSELLRCPNIHALSTTPSGAPYYALLQIFAYGTYTDYKTSATPLPPLTPPQLHKLRQLTLVSLSSLGAAHLHYRTLQSTLDLPTPRALEDLVISAVYAGLLRAKLDTRGALVEVSSAAGRDVAPAEIPAMVRTLQGWAGACEAVLAELDAQVAAVAAEAVRARAERDEYERLLAARREGAGGAGGGGAGGEKGGKGKRGMEGGEGWEEEEMEVEEGFGGGGGGGEGAGGANVSKRRTKGRFQGLMGGGRRR